MDDLDLSVLEPGRDAYLDFLQEGVLPNLEGSPCTHRPGVRAGLAGRKHRREETDESESDEGTDARGGRSKACREKARRGRINERFQELARLCEPEDPKTDKASILAESIKIITQLKTEAGQLRQLNKYLEERAGQYEKEKGQDSHQQNPTLQSQHQAGMQPMQQPGVQFPVNAPPQGGCQVAVGMPAAGVLGTSPLGAANPQAPQTNVFAAMGAPVPGCHMQGAFSSMPSTQNGPVPPTSWMPFMDTIQDHLLWPPVA